MQQGFKQLSVGPTNTNVGPTNTNVGPTNTNVGLIILMLLQQSLFSQSKLSTVTFNVVSVRPFAIGVLTKSTISQSFYSECRVVSPTRHYLPEVQTIGLFAIIWTVDDNSDASVADHRRIDTRWDGPALSAARR